MWAQTMVDGLVPSWDIGVPLAQMNMEAGARATGEAVMQWGSKRSGNGRRLQLLCHPRRWWLNDVRNAASRRMGSC